jgi:ATP-dependent RNA helicase DDX5/DBP2
MNKGYGKMGNNKGGYGGPTFGFGGNGYGGFDNGSFGANLNYNIDWAEEKLSTFQKNFYTEHPAVQAMSEEEAQAFRNEHQISFQRGWGPKPIRRFEEAGFPDYILAAIAQAGYANPSPIQAQGWPVALSGCDMIGIADTGSGKTCAFMLPGLIHIKAQPRLQWGDGPIALVLAPTRELAMQIQKEADRFGQSSGIRNCCVYGGVPKGPQCRDLKYGREVVIATPGRLIDLLDMGVTNLKRVTYLVLDEADRMLDMGFEDQVRTICSQLRPDRQTLLWSATWPKEVQSLARDLCKEDPVHVNIGSTDLKANHKIDQNIEVFDCYPSEMARMNKLFDLLQNLPMGKKLIFTQTKKGADQLCRELRRCNHQCQSIHGDKAQNERDWALHEFKSGNVPILIATDVAARGIDVKDIICVINFDFPTNIEDYVHRIGRTGRGGADGMAYSFFTTQGSEDKTKMARDLIKILQEAGQYVPEELWQFQNSNSKGGKKGGFGKGKGKGGFGGNKFGGGNKGFGKMSRKY